jgi:hypothetical protein
VGPAGSPDTNDLLEDVEAAKTPKLLEAPFLVTEVNIL